MDALDVHAFSRLMGGGFFCLQIFTGRAIMNATLQTHQGLMNRAEAAAYIRVCKTTLSRLNIPQTRIRKKVFYRKETLDKWIAKQDKCT
jgi:hypothetical protein